MFSTMALTLGSQGTTSKGTSATADKCLLYIMRLVSEQQILCATNEQHGQ